MNEPNDRLMYFMLLLPIVTDKFPSGCGRLPLIYVSTWRTPDSIPRKYCSMFKIACSVVLSTSKMRTVAVRFTTPPTIAILLEKKGSVKS